MSVYLKAAEVVDSCAAAAAAASGRGRRPSGGGGANIRRRTAKEQKTMADTSFTHSLTHSHFD